MLIGYARVSTSDGAQVLDIQHDALAEAGVEASRIYEDLASGRKDDRPGLTTCLKALQPGNTLVVWNGSSPQKSSRILSIAQHFS
jgi:DNA invertase Pin-like site-specific DNA recombinase